jgi:hypothetical protein
MSIDTLHSAGPRRGALKRYFARFEEGRIIRAAFFGMLIGTVSVLGLDLKNLIEENGGLFAQPLPSPTAVTVPVLPPAVETSGATGGGSDPRRFITSDEALLREPIRFSLAAGGVLVAVGSIDQGAAQRFADEVAARGEYIRTVSLDSPG